MPNTPPMGKFGFIGIGKQTVLGTTVAPTVWVRKTSISGAYPKIIRARTQAAFGTLDALPSDIVQRVAEFSFDFEADVASLRLILEHMLGNAPVVNVITPSQQDFNFFVPLVPFTIEITTPGENYRLADCQLTNLKIKWNAKGYVTCSISGKALSLGDLASPIAPVVPLSAFIAQNLSCTLAAAAIIPESFELELDVPVEFIDGANGLVTPVGFGRPDGNEMLRSCKISMSFRNLNTATKANYENNTMPALVANFVRATDILRFNIVALDVIERNLETPNGPTMTQISGVAVQSAGAWLTAAFV